MESLGKQQTQKLQQIGQIYILIEKKGKTCILTDVEKPEDRNVTQKEGEKKLKYNSLCKEMQRMWNMECVIKLLTCGVTGVVRKRIKGNMEATAGKL